MMESEFRLQWSRTLISYIWGQNREEHLLATSDHFELTVSDFFIVKITVVLWKQGKMTQYVRSAVSTAVMPEGEIIWGCPVLITPYHLLEFCLKTVMVLFFYFFILFLLPVQCTSVQLFSFFLLKTEVGFAFNPLTPLYHLICFLCIRPEHS